MLRRKVVAIVLAISVVIAYSVPCLALENTEDGGNVEYDVTFETDDVEEVEEEEECYDDDDDEIDIEGLEDGEYEEIQKFNELVDFIESKVEYDDNQVSLTDNQIDYLEDTYGEEAVDSMMEGVEKINQMADEGDLVVTDNGTIYESDNSDMTVQGSYNKNKVDWTVTGKVYYYSYKKAKTVRAAYRKAYLRWAAGDLIFGLILEEFPGVTLPLGINATNYQYVYQKIDSRNKKGIGIKLRTFWLTSLCEVRAQNKSFKGVLS